MPFPNYHSARMEQPSKFEKDSFRYKKLENAKGISVVLGRIKGEKSTTVQAYRFPKSKWTTSEARAWLKEHDKKPVSFTPASGDGAEAKAIISKNIDIKQPVLAGKKSEVYMKTLQEVMAENPALAQEVKSLKDESYKAGFDAHKKKTDRAVIVLNSDAYPKSVKEVAMKVCKDELENSSLEVAVSVYDAIQEQKKSETAAKETKTLGDTPAQADHAKNISTSTDGKINTRADELVEVKRLRGEV